MSDVMYLVQVEGADDELLEDVADGLGTHTDDNIVVAGKAIQPLGRDEVKEWLQQFADALDMELVET